MNPTTLEAFSPAMDQNDFLPAYSDYGRSVNPAFIDRVAHIAVLYFGHEYNDVYEAVSRAVHAYMQDGEDVSAALGSALVELFEDDIC